MLQNIYQFAPQAKADTRYLKEKKRASAVSWKDMSRIDQLIFPGLNPALKPSPLLCRLKTEIGACSKALLPALIFAGGWALQDHPLIATTSSTLLASAAIYGDIKLQGRLRTFETGFGLILPILCLSFYRAFTEGMAYRPLSSVAYLANGIASGLSLALLGAAINKLDLLEDELFNSGKGLDPARMDKSFAAFVQCLLPAVGFALYKSLPSHFALIGTLGVGFLTLWASVKQCNAMDAKVVQRDLQAFTLGSMVAAITGFVVSSGVLNKPIDPIHLPVLTTPYLNYM